MLVIFDKMFFYRRTDTRSNRIILNLTKKLQKKFTKKKNVFYQTDTRSEPHKVMCILNIVKENNINEETT